MDKLYLHANDHGRISDVTINSNRKPEVNTLSTKWSVFGLLCWIIQVILNTAIICSCGKVVAVGWLAVGLTILLLLTCQVITIAVVYHIGNMSGQKKAYNFINHSTITFKSVKKDQPNE